MVPVTHLYAPAISCEHCAHTIKHELATVRGISSVQVNVSQKIITLNYTDTQALAQAKALLKEIGYPSIRKG